MRTTAGTYTPFILSRVLVVYCSSVLSQTRSTKLHTRHVPVSRVGNTVYGPSFLNLGHCSCTRG